MSAGYKPWEPTAIEVLECFNPNEREHLESMANEAISFTLVALAVKCRPMHARVSRGGYRLDFRQDVVAVVYPCGHEGFSAVRDSPEAVTEAFNFFILRSSKEVMNG
jgi:hypothetical protein